MSLLDAVDVVLHRPQSSDNIGAVARAMKNFGLSKLVLVAPKAYDPVRAKTLAVHSEAVLDAATHHATLDEAIAPYVLVVATTHRGLAGRDPPLGPRDAAARLLGTARTGRVALLFGGEASGLPNAVLNRLQVYSSIPTSPAQPSMNLAQAVLLYAWSLYEVAGEARLPARLDPVRPGDEPAPLKLVQRLREKLLRLGVATGFLNAQQPERPLDELLRLLQRASPTRRELEMLLAAVEQVERTSTVLPRS